MREPLAWLHDQQKLARENPKRVWCCPIHGYRSPPRRLRPTCPFDEQPLEPGKDEQ